MGKSNQLRIKFTLVLGEKEKIKTKKVFYGSLFFIFLSVGGALAAWLFRIAWQKAENRFQIFRQWWTSELSPRITPLRIMFWLAFFNLSLWGWLNKETIFPIALGKTEKEIVLGTEDAVKIDDLQKDSIAGNSPQKALGEEKDLNLSLVEERCQKDKLEKKSSELCGEDPQDEALEKELRKIDDQARARAMAVRKPVARKVSCAEANDHPGKSDTKGKHTDEDCCPDPDEYPKPGCVYSPAGYALMLKR